eukprot:360813_1
MADDNEMTEEEIAQLKKDYEVRIQSLLENIEEKEGIIQQAKKDGFTVDDDSDYNTDSASVTDEDMPPLFGAHQQTIKYFNDEEDIVVDNTHEQPHPQPQIPQEIASIIHDEENQNNVDNKDNTEEEKKEDNSNGDEQAQLKKDYEARIQALLKHLINLEEKEGIIQQAEQD